MTSAPPIILTQLDLQRLERLLDSLDDYGPAAEALEQELSRAQIVERSEMPAGVVTMNSRVHCRDEGTGKDYHLTLVYPHDAGKRSEEHTSELQSLMRISYAVFCLKKKKPTITTQTQLGRTTLNI